MRPELAVAFAQAIEQFAVCEASLGTLLMVLNAAEPVQAFEELSSTIGFSQRIQLINRQTRVLGSEDRALVLAVTDRCERAARMRNRIVHGTWGFSDSLPNAVLLTPTSTEL